MFRWTPFAMVRITAFLVVGIIAAIFFPMALHQSMVDLLLAAGVISYFILFFINGKTKRVGIVMGSIGLCAVTLTGYKLVWMQTGTSRSSHFIHARLPIQCYVAVVRSVPQAKTKSWKMEMEVEAIKTKSWLPAEGKVMFYLAKDSLPMRWKYGDQILVYGSPRLVSNPLNPNEFDYSRYLRFRNIYHQQFAQSQSVKWLGSVRNKGFLYYSYKLRTWASNQIDKYIESDQAKSVASALVLGVTEGLDFDLLSAHAASGTMHILAVSGLHVSVIYGLLLILFKPFSKFRGSTWLMSILSLFCLWVFAFVTGLSPSVLRAVTMFSFVVLAKPFAKRTNIYNTLAASAFFLLLYQPLFVMSVGFQLSYIAVLGIVYLYRPIYNLWDIQSRVADWVWSLSCVSLAAQIATFSLGLLYFHQFPIYFLFSNLVVVPISTGVLLLGIGLLSFSFIPSIACILGKMIEILIYLINQIVFFTEKLPYSLINDIHISALQCCLLFGLLLGIIILFEMKSLRGLYIAFICGVVFSVLQWIHWIARQHEKQWVVYAINGYSVMDFIVEGQARMVADVDFYRRDDLIRFHIRPHRIWQGVNHVQPDTLLSTPPIHNLDVVLWQNKMITRLQKPNIVLPIHWYTDYLVVSHNSLNMEKIQKEQVGMIILDATNSRKYSNKLIKFAAKKNILVYSVLQQGAFILTISI